MNAKSNHMLLPSTFDHSWMMRPSLTDNSGFGCAQPSVRLRSTPRLAAFNLPNAEGLSVERSRNAKMV
ncbi:MAG: hypothetical protein HC827_20985 [Cyanobacteria bacterium RM1_2_2]|nr:hypothetical protein [Cyanobacteria bacterium RM1_2_2]